MLPNFLIIGAMKAGTDSLWEYLRHHPQVFMSETKELDFFVKELNWQQGMAWYERQFEEAGDARGVGEASTSYTKFPLYPDVPARIAAMIPQVRLIYLVRHPVERIRSQYLHQVLVDGEKRPIEAAALADPSYLDLSRYAMQLERYLDHFPRENLLIVRSEDLRNDRRATVDRVLRFLGLDEACPEDILGQEFHRSAEKRVLRPLFRWAHGLPGYAAVARAVPQPVKDWTLAVRTRGLHPDRARISDVLTLRLEDMLREDVVRLRRYIGNDFDGWGIG